MPPEQQNNLHTHAIQELGQEQLSGLRTMLDISLQIISSPKDIFRVTDWRAISILHIQNREFLENIF
jgi:hypothetical protein